MNTAYLVQAIVSRDINKLNELKNNKYILDNNILNYAILTNNINIIKLIIEMGAKPSYLTLDYAIFMQNINIINIVLDIGAKPSNNTIMEAFNTNNIDIILLIMKLMNLTIDDIKKIKNINTNKFCNKLISRF